MALSIKKRNISLLHISLLITVITLSLLSKTSISQAREVINTIKDIQRSREALLSIPESQQDKQKINELQMQLDLTLEKGKVVSDNLKDQIINLKSEKETLKHEKAKLEQVQTALTSGLIGAILTSLVAIIGAVSNSKYSKSNRDYRKLEVIEKIHYLKNLGYIIPEKILTSNGVSLIKSTDISKQ